MNYDNRCNEKKLYAEAYVIPQCYGNLLDETAALFYGTIFKDLVRPYRKSKKMKKDCNM